MLFYTLLALAGCWALVARLIAPDKFTWSEVGAQMLAGFLVAFLGWQLGISAKTSRTEIWNGEVTGKSRDIVSCDHSYSCNCREVCTGQGKDRTCSTVCDTCYEHPYDIDWDVQTNVGNFSIRRVDRQGAWEPPRWTAVAKGQPMARENSYTNYVAAQDHSLYHQTIKEMANLPDVPAYPRVFDYQYADRVLTVGVTLADLPQWQADLADALKELGPKKQANITVVIAATPDQNYRAKVEAAWEGVNKNDVVVVIGVQPDDLKIIWADVITFAGNIGNEGLRVDLRNALLDTGTVERTKVLALVTDDVRRLYERPHMKDFEYLRNALEPDTWYQIVFGILFLILNGGLTVYFRQVDFNLLGDARRVG